MVIAHECVRTFPCPTQGTAEESFCTGAVSCVTQQHIDDLAVLIHSTIEVAFLFAAEAEDLVHVPSPSPPSPMALECLSQLRPEGLHPIEHRARRRECDQYLLAQVRKALLLQRLPRTYPATPVAVSPATPT